jgi:hypothetical protein
MDVEPKIQIGRLPTNHLTSSNWEDLWGANSARPARTAVRCATPHLRWVQVRSSAQARVAGPGKPAEKVGFLWIRITIVFHLENKNE